MSLQHIVNRQIKGLIIAPNDSPPINNPPVWDSQPNPSFVFGTASNFDMTAISSDPDMDSLTYSMNTGAVSLPSGVTWTAGTGILAYGGIGAITTTNGHIVTLDDGTDTTDSTAFDIVISSNVWPADLHVQTAHNVAGIYTQMETLPYTTWQRKKDLVFLQGRYPTSGQVTDTFNGIANMRADNSALKIVEYSFINRAKDTAKDNIDHLGFEVITNTGGGSSWYAVSANSSGGVYVNDPSNERMINPNYEGTDPAGGFATYADAFWDLIDNKAGSGGPVNLEDSLDGRFWDSTDFKDFTPREFEADLVTPTTIDYAKPKSSGNTNPAAYRAGLKYGVAVHRGLFGDDKVHCSNGGRDFAAVNELPGDNEWAGYWDYRLTENMNSLMNVGNITGSNDLELQNNNMNTTLNNALRAALISLTMVDRTASNRLGTGLVGLDFVFNWNTGVDPIPDSIATIPQGHYEMARFIAGLSMLQDGWAAAPHLTRGQWAFPLLDEFVYTFGSYIGGTPSIGSIDETTTDYTFTRRAADDNGWFFVLGDGGSGPAVCWGVNLNTPTGQSPYPQAQVGADEVTPPTPPNAGVWRFADGNYTNPDPHPGRVTGENQSPLVNDGSLVGSTLNAPRWHARMLVEDTS